MKYDPLIFGKDQTERIVSLEVMDDKLILFKEMSDGSIETEYRDNKFWFLLTSKEHDSFIRLEGTQPYKWMYTCDTREKYNLIRKRLYRERKDFYSIWNPKEASMVKDGITYFKGMKVNEVSLLSFDIETDGLRKTQESEVYCITNTFRKNGDVIRKGFFLDEFNNQSDMILAWCEWVRKVNPTLIIGHNIYSFDFPYLKHVCGLHGIEMNLGRDNSPIVFEERSSSFRKDGSQEYDYKKINIFGREIVDTFFLSIRYDLERKFESYGLKSIVKQLGLEKKDRTFIDASKIKHYFYNDKEMWRKVKIYAEEDSDDSIKLYDKMIPAIFYFTQSVGKSFQEMLLSASGSQVNNILVRHYLQKNFSIPKAEELDGSIEGGISFAIPGLYKHMVKVDLKSAYPSQILRFKLYDKKKDPDAAFYNAVHYFTYERFDLKKKFTEMKDKYYYDREQSSKVFINSAYGLMTTPGLNFNCKWIGAKITEETRKVIDQALVWASGKGKDHWMSVFKKKVGKEESEDEDSI